MERSRFIQHAGQTVALLDFSRLNDLADWTREADRARALISQRPADGTLFTLTDVTDVRYDKEVLQLLKDLAGHNKPYVKAAAVVTNSSLNRSVIAMISLVIKRNVQAFADQASALEWLVKQV